MSSATWSSNARATTVTPNGPPSASPAGTATPAMSSRFRKFVYVPSARFTPSGSAATSAIVGWRTVVGSSRASHPAMRSSATGRSASRRAWAAASAGAVWRPAAATMAPTVGSTSPGWASTKAPTAAWRSATSALS
jgi:hypothetical protein